VGIGARADGLGACAASERARMDCCVSGSSVSDPVSGRARIGLRRERAAHAGAARARMCARPVQVMSRFETKRGAEP
jgi:hypothetical protein